MAGPILRDGVNVRAPLYNEARHAVEALDRDRAKARHDLGQDACPVEVHGRLAESLVLTALIPLVRGDVLVLSTLRVPLLGLNVAQPEFGRRAPPTRLCRFVFQGGAALDARKIMLGSPRASFAMHADP